VISTGAAAAKPARTVKQSAIAKSLFILDSPLKFYALKRLYARPPFRL
jgi:hypothetical protein